MSPPALLIYIICKILPHAECKTHGRNAYYSPDNNLYWVDPWRGIAPPLDEISKN